MAPHLSHTYTGTVKRLWQTSQTFDTLRIWKYSISSRRTIRESSRPTMSITMNPTTCGISMNRQKNTLAMTIVPAENSQYAYRTDITRIVMMMPTGGSVALAVVMASTESRIFLPVVCTTLTMSLNPGP